MKQAIASIFLAAGLASVPPVFAASSDPILPAGLYNIVPLNDVGAPTGNVLGVICLAEGGGGRTKSFNNNWSLFSYLGFDVNPTHHISGHWGVSVSSPWFQTAVLMGNDAEISAAPSHPTVPVIGNVLIFEGGRGGH